jgi:hypothetical protein
LSEALRYRFDSNASVILEDGAINLTSGCLPKPKKPQKSGLFEPKCEWNGTCKSWGGVEVSFV